MQRTLPATEQLQQIEIRVKDLTHHDQRLHHSSIIDS